MKIVLSLDETAPPIEQFFKAATKFKRELEIESIPFMELSWYARIYNMQVLTDDTEWADD